MPDVATSEWFSLREYPGGIFAIREAHIDPFLSGVAWVLTGRESALLIDSATGVRSIRGFIDGHFSLPVTAVALNCFYDHAGGLHEFEARAAHRGDVAALETPSAKSSVADLFVSDDMFLEMPAPGFRAQDYRLRPAKITHVLSDGDCFDLGGRRISVIHTPGVTPGSICLWEEETGALFTSDTLFIDPEGRLPLPRDKESFYASLKRLRDLPVQQVFPGHFGPFDRDKMDWLIEQYF
ncbi:MAG: MBL fold metallo-hydrolase [Pseudomonadota bacterium]